jgi:hypothetical protein
MTSAANVKRNGDASSVAYVLSFQSTIALLKHPIQSSDASLPCDGIDGVERDRSVERDYGAV